MRSTPAEDSGYSSDLPAKLNKLFDIMHKPNERPLSNEVAAERITEKTGVSISGQYLWQLRKGVKTNPTVTHLRAIADFFGVKASYLIDPGIDPDIEKQLDMLALLRDAKVRDLAMRASGLTSHAIDSLRAMVDHARNLEHLPPVGDIDSNG